MEIVSYNEIGIQGTGVFFSNAHVKLRLGSRDHLKPKVAKKLQTVLARKTRQPNCLDS